MKRSLAPRAAIALSGAAALCASLLCFTASAKPQTGSSSPQDAQLANRVDKAIDNTPFWSVFNNILINANNGTVTLRGYVVQPTEKHDIEEAIRHVEGVTNLADQIEVLPENPMDDQIRQAERRAIYGDPALQRYSEGSHPTIHIVVDRGHVTLEGAVDNSMDKEIANQRALSVTGAFSVTNHLQVRNP